MGIRASVDALCRDEQGQISHDPLTKRLLTQRESLAKPSKQAINSAFAHLQLYICLASSYLPSVLHTRKRSNANSRISCHRHHHNILLSLVQTPLLEQVKVIIFLPSVSRVARGVHGHQAIVFLHLHISTVDREVHHSKHKPTPFLFEAGRPGGRVRAHTLRLRKFRVFVPART